jgi:hypothetical protein
VIGTQQQESQQPPQEELPHENPTSSRGDRWLGVVAAAAGCDLSADEGWPMLAATLDRADAAGWSVADGLTRVAADGGASRRVAARDLAYRVMDACPDAIPAPPTPAEMNGQAAPSLGRGHEQAEASIRRSQQPPERGHAVGR